MIAFDQWIWAECEWGLIFQSLKNLPNDLPNCRQPSAISVASEGSYESSSSHHKYRVPDRLC
jgi:hypothetical protein